MKSARRRIFEKRSQIFADAIAKRWPQWIKQIHLVPKTNTTGQGYLNFEIPRQNKRASKGLKLTVSKGGVFVEFDRDIIHVDDYANVEADVDVFAVRLMEEYLADKLLVVSWKQAGNLPNISTTIGIDDCIPSLPEVKSGARCKVRSWSGQKDSDFVVN